MSIDRLLALRASGDLAERLAALAADVAGLRSKLAEPVRQLEAGLRRVFRASDVGAADPRALARRCRALVAARDRYEEWARLSHAQPVRNT